MPLQTLTAPPTAPVRGSDSETFITAAEANIAWWSTHVSEQNTLSAQLMATSALIAVAPDYADPTLLAIASSGLTIAADKFVYFNGASTALLGTVTSFGRSLMDDADATAGRSTLGLGTIATQAASAVAITGGSVTGITDITVADGGTGASTAAGARTNLGAAASGANSDITSLSALSTALSVAQGGTGATSAAAALSALGGIGITGSDLASNGYVELSNGLFLFWGTFTAAANASTTFTYSTIDAGLAPTTFSRVVVSGGPSSGGDNMPHVTAATTTNFTVFNAFGSTVTTFFIGVGV